MRDLTDETTANRASIVMLTRYNAAARIEFTQRLLDKLRAARPEVELETIKVLQHPRRALRDTCACAQCRCGVFMIPALIVGKHRWYHAPPLHEILAALDAVASQR